MKVYDVIQYLDVKLMFRGKYYKFKDLREYLDNLNDEIIETEDYILTPYYISYGKQMELYEYALKIVTEGNFEDYLLRITGKKDIKYIPDNIVQLNRSCYIECEEQTNTIKVAYLVKYINFILSNDDIRYQVENYFKDFDISNLFFEIY